MSPLKTAVAILVTCCAANSASAQTATAERFNSTYVVEMLVGNWRLGEMAWTEVHQTQSADEAALVEQFILDGIANGTIEDDLFLAWYLIVLDVRVREIQNFTGATSGQPEIADLSSVTAPTHKPGTGYPTKPQPWEK